MGKGAEKAGEWMKQGSDKLKTKMKPEERPRPIDPRVQTGIRYARKGSHVAVQVSSYIGKGICFLPNCDTVKLTEAVWSLKFIFIHIRYNP